MSGFSEATNCPRCGSLESLECSVDGVDVNWFCSECGYGYHTEYTVHDLEAVNEERVEFELEPLTAQKPPVEGWKDQQGLCEVLSY